MPVATTIKELLRLRAEQCPDASCLLASGRKPLSYAGLWEQCGYVEAKLRSAGFGPESCIAAALPTNAEAAAAFLCFPANCTYAPLNPDDSAAGYEVAFKRLDPEAVVVLDGHPIVSDLPLIKLLPIPADEAGRFSLQMPATGRTKAQGEPRPDNVALLLQTSGIATEPKAAIHTHRTLLCGAE